MIFALFGTKFCRGIGVGKMGCSDAYRLVSLRKLLGVIKLPCCIYFVSAFGPR
jgi:hypothetical protein